MTHYEITRVDVVETPNNIFKIELLKDLNSKGEYVAFYYREDIFSIRPAVIENGVQSSPTSTRLWTRIDQYSIHTTSDDASAMQRALQKFTDDLKR